MVQVEQQSGVNQVFPDEAYEPAPFAFGPGQLRRLKNEADRFLGAGGLGSVSWCALSELAYLRDGSAGCATGQMQWLLSHGRLHRICQDIVQNCLVTTMCQPLHCLPAALILSPVGTYICPCCLDSRKLC